jgi:uncharacterized protein involved in type VI secretion and phage assembly
MNLLDVLMDSDRSHFHTSKIAGVVVGVVTNNQDPDGLNRVKVKFPWLSDEDESTWARVAVPMAGKDRGIYFLPEVDDEVLVAFEQGDLRFPYVVGCLWNGKDTPPAKNDDGKNNIRMIKSRGGHMIRLSDEDGKEKIDITDKDGKNSLVLDIANNTLTITAQNGTIKLDAQKIEIKSSADTKIEAGAGMDVKANATMNVKGATVNIN